MPTRTPRDDETAADEPEIVETTNVLYKMLCDLNR